MNRKMKSSVLIAGLLGLVALFAGSRSVSAAAAESPRARIAGVWDSAITITNCNGTVLATFRGLGLFSPDGSLQQANNMSPTVGKMGLGLWHHVGQQHYTASFTFFRFDPTGTYLGTQSVTRDIQLDSAGNSFTGTIAFSSYDPNGVVVAAGCGTETSVRVLD